MPVLLVLSVAATMAVALTYQLSGGRYWLFAFVASSLCTIACAALVGSENPIQKDMCQKKPTLLLDQFA